MDRIKTLK